MLSGLVPSNADAYLDSMTNFRVLLPSFSDLYLVSHTFTEFRGLVPSFADMYHVKRTGTE